MKEELGAEENEFEVGEYFKKGYDNMVEKLTTRKEKLGDIREAMRYAKIKSKLQLR